MVRFMALPPGAVILSAGIGSTQTYQTKGNKFHNVRTEIDGITFDSKREAKRYMVLTMLELAGEIRNLKLQPEYVLEVNGVKICKYVADFAYQERRRDGSWLSVVEDVKSPATRTAVYRVKKKLMLAIHEIEVRET